MNLKKRAQFVAPLLLSAVGLAVLAPVAASAPMADGLTTSVYSQVEKGYQRPKLPDGSFKRELYVMSNGGQIPGTIKDNVQDKMQFAPLAGVIAEHLARQKYFPAENKDAADLLIVVHWGTTRPFSDGTYRGGMESVFGAANELTAMNRTPRVIEPPPARDGEPPQSAGVSITASVEDLQRQAAIDNLNSAMMTQDMFNKARDQANEKNARLLGYMREINTANGIQRFAGAGTYYDDLISDIEEARYYVVISAYDFRQTVTQKKPTLLWVTRVSIRSPGNNFGERMATMLANASRYFGRETDRLVRQYERKGNVEIGETTVIGVVAEPTPAVVPAKPTEAPPKR